MSELERRVRTWRIERLRSLWTEGGLRLAAAAAGYLLAAFALDAAVTLPQSVRWGFFGVGAAGLLAGLYAYLLKPLSLLETAAILQAAAQRYPSAKAYLRSAWELARAGIPAHTSEELASEHVARAEKLARELPADPVFPCRPSKGASRRFGLAAAAWGLSLPWLYHGPTQPQRILLPWRDIRLETMVRVAPGDARVPWGEEARIEAAWIDGRGDAGLLLETRSPGASWQRAPWDQEAVTAVFHVQGLSAPFEYRVGYKDLRTRAYRLTPIPLPRLSELKVRLRAPSGETEELPLEGGGEVAALRGSWVTVRGKPDAELESASLEVSYLGAPVPMRPQEDGAWEAGFPLKESGGFKILLVSKESARDPNPVSYGLRALDDKPPVAELLSPAFEVEISPKERLPVAYSVRDDHGLRSVSLFWQVPGQAAAEIPLKRFTGPVKESLGDYAWDLSRLSVGARVEFWISATDNARPDAQTAVSSRQALRIVDFESAHERTREQWAGMEQALKKLSASEEEARKRMAELARASGSEAAKLKREWEPQDAKLSQEWAGAARGMEEFSKAMRQDPYANEGMTQAAEMISDAVKGMREEELSSAREAARAGDYAQAERKHAGLQEGLKKAADLLSKGRDLQNLQDFWAQSHRMDQSGSELSNALEKLAEGGQAPKAEDVRKLQEALSELRKQMAELAKAIDAMPKPEPGSSQEKNRQIYKVPLQSAQRTADALQEALERGDYAAAAKLAKQLSQQLSQVHSGVAKAARSSVAESPEQAALRELQQAMDLWKEAVEGQSRGLSMTQKIEDEAQASLRGAQQDLLKQLAKEQAAVLRDAGSLGASVPPEAVNLMQRVLKEFEAAQVREAPQALERAAQRLSLEPGEALGSLAERERKIREKLMEGARRPNPSESLLSEMMAAGAVQRQASKKTSDLGERLESLPPDAGAIDPKARESLSRAQAEQKAAEESLSKRDSSAARGHQEKALELLENGLKSMSDSLSRRQSISQSSAGAFSRPRGVARPMPGGRGGRTGSDMGFVPLPNASEYQPPREIRREVEKSLQERRPKAFDDVIRDYFKNMSE